ncbi:hypothetical protein AVEN_194995-1 [Araneus ventricosus]|uniref:Uncharacterized protein n=1 Tax=Araneus ventricosus TaxID=182803 RepID=A0A4Y2HP20_ARAVE|nr:hypothetical protein AVEN_194995-1 [Araneus ventricosus]
MSCVRAPPTSTTPDNIERVRRMLADDGRLSLRMMAEELKISLDSVSNIIHEHLQERKKKVYAFPTLRRSSNVDRVFATPVADVGELKAMVKDSACTVAEHLPRTRIPL